MPVNGPVILREPLVGESIMEGCPRWKVPLVVRGYRGVSYSGTEAGGDNDKGRPVVLTHYRVGTDGKGIGAYANCAFKRGVPLWVLPLDRVGLWGKLAYIIPFNTLVGLCQIF